MDLAAEMDVVFNLIRDGAGGVVSTEEEFLECPWKFRLIDVHG